MGPVWEQILNPVVVTSERPLLASVLALGHQLYLSGQLDLARHHWLLHHYFLPSQEGWVSLDQLPIGVSRQEDNLLLTLQWISYKVTLCHCLIQSCSYSLPNLKEKNYKC